MAELNVSKKWQMAPSHIAAEPFTTKQCLSPFGCRDMLSKYASSWACN